MSRKHGQYGDIIQSGIGHFGTVTPGDEQYNNQLSKHQDEETLEFELIHTLGQIWTTKICLSTINEIGFKAGPQVR